MIPSGLDTLLLKEKPFDDSLHNPVSVTFVKIPLVHKNYFQNLKR